MIKTEPYSHVVTEDSFEHSLWKVPLEESALILSEFEKMDTTYIADGHHRCAAAANVGKRRRERLEKEGIEVTGEESFNYFMTILYPSDNLKVLDYNRVLNSLNDMSTDEFIEKMSKFYSIEPLKEGESRSPEVKGQVNMFINNGWLALTIKPEYLDETDVVESLDCALLSKHCFNEILGIENIRTDNRVEFVGGIRGIDELESKVQSGCHAAIAMHPVTMEEVFRVAD